MFPLNRVLWETWTTSTVCDSAIKLILLANEFLHSFIQMTEHGTVDSLLLYSRLL